MNEKDYKELVTKPCNSIGSSNCQSNLNEVNEVPHAVFACLQCKEVTDQGGRRDLKAVPFISYLSGLLKTQLLSDDLVAGVEIRCQEKGSCPAACHLCRQAGRETASPTPVLLEVSRVVPLYSLVQDNVTKEQTVPGGFLSIGKQTGEKNAVESAQTSAWRALKILRDYEDDIDVMDPGDEPGLLVVAASCQLA
ncbi:Astrotactin-2 [Anabarilius grahami]|uniref:Astrotactin-2 n=1 Tax=Anabarilius grahami TaxID=495550 RepID=A0A3N0XW99_ANAGA|nr:Astrotactin-2 [Anabarilius grahami]